MEAVRRELQNRAESLTPWQAAKELEGIKREAQHLGEAPGVTAGESLDRLQSFLEGLEAIEKAFRKQRVSAQAAGVLKKAAELRQAMEEKGAELREMQREEGRPERTEERPAPKPEEPPRPPETSEEDIPVTDREEYDTVNRKKILEEFSYSTRIEELLNKKPELTGSNRERLLFLVQDSELSEIVNELYRSGAVVGDGGTAAILVQELSHGVSIHLKKAEERLKQLKRLGHSRELSLNDLDVVEALIDDLEFWNPGRSEYGKNEL